MRNDTPRWGMSANRDAPPPPTFSRRLLGGPPLTVLIRLAFVSLVVGALLMWLRLEPLDLVWDAVRTVEQLWAMGYAALGEIGRYVLAGAVIVIPVWLITRLFSIRTVRHAGGAERWPTSGSPGDIRNGPTG